MTRRDERPALFVDRDGTLNEELGYLSDLSRMRLLPGVGAAVRAASCSSRDRGTCEHPRRLRFILGQSNILALIRFLWVRPYGIGGDRGHRDTAEIIPASRSP